MCTLTYLPKKTSGYFLTSNRDESIRRKPALVPQIYAHGALNLVYPKDAQAGGTWLAAANNGVSICLLNGAFDKHIPKPPYRRSRGLVLLDFFDFISLELFIQLYDFNGIEPFTLLVFSEPKVITELRWDSKVLFHKNLDGNLPHIWSSATLYDVEIRQKREQSFKLLLENKNEIAVADLLQFHHFTGDTSQETSIKMELNANGVQTISVSCIESTDAAFHFYYHDLIKDITNQVVLEKSNHINRE